MDTATRPTGLRILGRVPWGTHFCQFYRTRRDLLDVLVPYFKAGLMNNEACMWICSEPLGVDEAKRALRAAVPDLAARMRKGQIEILPHTEWYLRGGRFAAKRVLQDWIDKLDAALDRGYDGLRLSGKTFWLEKKDWARFTDYEAAIDNTIGRYRMIGLCTYSLDRCGAQEIVDVLNNHRQTLIRRAGKWTLVESSGRKQIEAELARSQRSLKALFDSDLIGVMTGDRERVLDANATFLKIAGYSRKDLEAGRIRWRSVLPPEFRRARRAPAATRKGRTVRPFEIEFLRRDGRRIPLLVGAAVIERAPLTWVCFVLDISRRKGAERALQKAYDEMEKQVRSRTADLAQAVRRLRGEVLVRRRTERDLAERNRILDAYFASVLSPLVILDAKFNFVRVNEAYAKSCAKRVEELVGRNHFELFPDAENKAIFRQVVKLRRPYRVKARPFSYPEHPEWGVTYWDWALDPILNDRGAVEYVVFALSDVTEETRAHEELRRSESLLRTVLDTLPIGVWIVDQEGRILIRNDFGRKIWGGARDITPDGYGELKGWRLQTGQPLSAGDWPSARAVFKGETVLQEEIEIETYDGRRKTVLISALPIRDPSGAVTGAVVANEEITAKLAEERTVREQSALLELAHDAIIVRDIEDRITFWNHGAETLYGWRKEEALGRVVHQLLETRFPVPLDRVLAQVIKDGHWEGELVHARKNGRTLVVESRWAVLPGRENNPAAFLEINRDITERKSVEEAMRQVSSYTRGLIEASLDPLVTISPAGKITDVNKATELATGVPRAELIGSDFSDYFTEPAKARESYQEVFRKGSVRDYPLALRHVSGKVIDVLYNAAVYWDQAGAAVGVFAAARDITARKTAEEERLRLATAIEQITDGISILNLEDRILSANPAFAAHHGFRQPDLIGRPFHEILRLEVGDSKIIDRLREAVAAGNAWSWHITQRPPQGGVRELDLAVSPIHDGTGRPVNAIVVERDVTQEFEFQDRIRQWQKMEALGTLAGGIAHDFNNLLLPILINTELTLDELRDDDPLVHRLSNILEAARRGQDMVKQIIAFSQQKEQERRPVEIPPIITEALEFLRVSMPKNIRIVERLGPGGSMAIADPTQIHQIVVNLGTNAAHAMREKGGTLEIGLAETVLDEADASGHIDLRPGQYLRLTVKDTGQGMTPEVASRVFEPFFTTKKKGEGTGMGLAVVHGIVKSHGGTVTLRTEPGKGTEFTILLPRVIGTQPAVEKGRKPYPKGTERVLFVDDEDIQVRAMSRLLEHLGYRVVGLTNSRAALEIVRRDPEAFDLAIMDQTMPDMSGAELAREILRLRPDLPIILCTGYSETIDEPQALAIGIKAFMLKPFTAKDIAMAIRRVLPRRSGPGSIL